MEDNRRTGKLSHMKSILDRVNDCPICGLEGIQKAVELLPKTGTLMTIRHPDGKIHRWAAYDSIYDIGITSKRAVNPIRMKCPKCHKFGRVNHFFADKKTPHEVSYYIIHEKIEGTWGKSKLDRRRRCYIRDSEQREMVLRKLGRCIR